MAKINLDKYYTPKELAKSCIDKTFEVIGKENITDIIEPSAGNGSFSLQMDCTAYDIEPEHESIIKQDFLKLDLPYKKGRLIIGNPPFGTGNTLSVKFYKKSYSLGDYIAFILPVSQYKNNRQMYQFDLIHSEIITSMYSGRKLKTSFNIYRRPVILNKNPIDYTLKDVFVGEYRRNGSYKIPIHFDFAMCGWGTSLGKEVFNIGTFAQENYIIITNDKLKTKIIWIMKNTDWLNLYPVISSPKIQTWKIYKYLKEQIPELN